MGAVTAPSTGSSHVPVVLGVDQLDPVGPWSDVEAAGLTEVEQHRPGVVQQLEDSERAVGGHEVQIGHPASEQRMSLAEVVVDVQPGDPIPASRLRGSSMLASSDTSSTRAFMRSSRRWSAV